MKVALSLIASALLLPLSVQARILATQNYKCVATNSLGVSQITLDTGSLNAKVTYGMMSVTWKGGSILYNTEDRVRFPRANVRTAAGVPLEMVFLPSQNFSEGPARLLGVAFIPAYVGVPIASSMMLVPFGRPLPMGFSPLFPVMVGGIPTATLACDVHFK